MNAVNHDGVAVPVNEFHEKRRYPMKPRPGMVPHLRPEDERPPRYFRQAKHPRQSEPVFDGFDKDPVALGRQSEQSKRDLELLADQPAFKIPSFKCARKQTI